MKTTSNFDQNKKATLTFRIEGFHINIEPHSNNRYEFKVLSVVLRIIMVALFIRSQIVVRLIQIKLAADFSSHQQSARDAIHL